MQLTSIPFNSAQVNSTQFDSIPVNSILFDAIQFNSFQFKSSQVQSSQVKSTQTCNATDNQVIQPTCQNGSKGRTTISHKSYELQYAMSNNTDTCSPDIPSCVFLPLVQLWRPRQKTWQCISSFSCVSSSRPTTSVQVATARASIETHLPTMGGPSALLYWGSSAPGRDTNHNPTHHGRAVRPARLENLHLVISPGLSFF
jgi:hypothetical protein